MKRLKNEIKTRLKALSGLKTIALDCISLLNSVSKPNEAFCVLDEIIERFALKDRMQFEANVLLIHIRLMIFKTKAMKKPAEAAVLSVSDAHLLLPVLSQLCNTNIYKLKL